MHRKSYCSTSGVCIDKMLKFIVKIVYLMGKALSLSYPILGQFLFGLALFLYARLEKNECIMAWRCPSAHPSVHMSVNILVHSLTQ